jgi:hypothetical protein
MSKKQEGGVITSSGKWKRMQEKGPFPQTLWINAVFLLIIFFILLTAFECNKPGEENLSRSILQHKLAMSDMGEKIEFSILIRKNIDSGRIRRIYFRVKLNEKGNPEKCKAVAHKIIRDVLEYEKCHGISIDFGPLGQVDFAPDGNWLMAGSVPAGNYDRYQVHYHFNTELFNE